jgi:RNA polymerase sigma-70 factor (ECF subfamily)
VRIATPLTCLAWLLDFTARVTENLRYQTRRRGVFHMGAKSGPSTRASLVLRLKDLQDQQAWAEFAEKYTPWIYQWWCRRKGLQDADSQEIVQEVLRKLARAMPRFDYDPSKGRFRHWLARIIKNALNDHWRKTRRQSPGKGPGDEEKSDPLASIVDPDQLPEPMLRLMVRDYLDAAEGKLSQERRDSGAWKLLRLHVEGELPVEALMANSAMSEGAVRMAISRARGWLKEFEQSDENDAK